MRRSKFQLQMFAPVLLILASGCATFVPTEPPGAAEPVVHSAPVSYRGYLYVANQNNTIVAYAPGQSKPSLTISLPAYTGQLTALAFDGKGNLYAANRPTSGNQGSVTVYPPGATRPTRTIAVDAPQALAADRLDNLYVLSCQSCPAFHHPRARASVAVFPPGATKPSYVITKGLSEFAFALALDSSRNLFVATCTKICAPKDYPPFFGGTVAAYKAGTSSPAYTISNGICGPDALAVDSANNLYVGNGACLTVAVYASGATTPKYFAWIAHDAGGNVFSVALDAARNLYVPAGNNTYIFLPGSGQVWGTMGGGGQVAFGSKGYAYVLVVANDVLVYSPGSRMLVHKISNGLSVPFAMVISP